MIKGRDRWRGFGWRIVGWWSDVVGGEGVTQSDWSVKQGKVERQADGGGISWV